MKQTPEHTLKRGERGKKEGRVNVRLPGDHQHWLRRVSGARKVTVGASKNWKQPHRNFDK